MRVGIALGVGLLCLASVGVVAANSPPLASAGLDQEARANTTVYLDAGGSLDPDGSIASYEWRIVRPDGNTTTPECRRCPQTWFVPREVGRYNVTATVTDEDGATRSDTLYVAVSAPLRLPSSSGSGGGGGATTAALSGGNPGDGNWNAVVYDGNELTISTTRGTDFVLGTPDGQVRISQSQLDEARADDGKATFDELDYAFHEVGLSKRDFRVATERTMHDGNTCAASQGSCTTRIRDDILTVGGDPVGDAEPTRGTYNSGIRDGRTRSDSSPVTLDQTIRETVTGFLNNGDSDDSASTDTTGDSSPASVVGETITDAVSTVFDSGDDGSDPVADDSEDDDTIDVSGAVP